MTPRRRFVKLLILASAAPQLGISSSRVVDLLRTDATGFTPVSRDNPVQLPRDHGAHPDFRTEWWYLTANLRDESGRRWGLQWTLFRHALQAGTDREGWQSQQIWMAHAAVTSPTIHQYEERFARGGIGQAGVELSPDTFSAWIDDWRWEGKQSLFPAELAFTVGTQRIRMVLDATGEFVRQGDRGFSQKSADGQASHYYSQPHINARAQIEHEGITTQLNGQAWLDREWSSELLGEQQQGWDWFSLHLSDGRKLMAFQLREQMAPPWRSGTLVAADGSQRGLGAAEIQLLAQRRPQIVTPSGKLRLPLEWQLSLPTLGESWHIEPLYPQQWMGTSYPYWEGVVLVNAGAGGEGYMELTGYDR